MPELKVSKQQLKQLELKGDTDLEADFSDTIKAVRLFINSQVTESETALQARYGSSLIHTHGTTVLAVLKGLMTYDDEDLDFALDCLKQTVETSSYLRKEQTFPRTFTGLIFGNGQKNKMENLEDMTMLQKHAEVTYAESYLLKALLSILTESSMMTFVKESLAIRQSFNIYKTCYKFLLSIFEKNGHQGLIEAGVDNHFVTSVYLGMGGFNLILSILPAKLLRLFEIIGFGGNRDFGLECLCLGAGWPTEKLKTNDPLAKLKIKKAVNFFSDSFPQEEKPGTRRFICDLALSLYHVLLSTMVRLPGCDFPLASKQIGQNLAANPNSFIYLIFGAKVSQAKRETLDAIEKFQMVIEKQKDWRQLSHICFWDLGLCYAACGEWIKASDCFDTLYKENKWSPSIYLYLKAVMLYTADPSKYKQEVSEMMKIVPTLLKKVAGRSIPLEKFVSRKARKFNMQNQRLLFPAYEIIYMWNGFDLIPDAQLESLLTKVDQSLVAMDSEQQVHLEKTGNDVPYSSYYDDFCLARFFKGLAVRELAMPSSNYLVPPAQMLELKPNAKQLERLQYAQKQLEYIILQADDIELDHWILPFARYELGHLFVRMGEFEKAGLEYAAAQSGGYGEKDAGQQKHKASMESSLHLKVHNAIMELCLLKSIQSNEPLAIPETDPED